VSSSSDRVRVEFEDGWVELRFMTPRDLLFFRDATDLASLFERAASAVLAHSYEGDTLDLPLSQARRLMRQWREKSEEEALPPVPGESSP